MIWSSLGLAQQSTDHSTDHSYYNNNNTIDKASEHSTMFSDTTIRAIHNVVRAQLIVTTEVPIANLLLVIEAHLMKFLYDWFDLRFVLSSSCQSAPRFLMSACNFK